MRSRARDYRTVESLNSDRDDIAWYWRLLAYLSSCLILGGFLILPATFDTNAQLRVTKAALGIFSVALLAVGFSLTALVCFACRNWIFQTDCIFLPSLTASTLGLLTVFYSFIISSRFEWNIAALLVTVGSGVSILVYATLLVYTQRRIAAVRRNPDSQEPIGLIQQPPLASPSLSYHDPRLFDNHVVNMYPTARYSGIQEPRILADALSEEELLRQQMLMLLVNKPEPSISTDSAANTFNRIDFTPADEPDSETLAEPHLVRLSGLNSSPGPVLPTTYYGYYAPPGAHSYNPQPSWQINTNMNMQPWDGVWRSGPAPAPPPQISRPPSDTARREERRREIEQGR